MLGLRSTLAAQAALGSDRRSPPCVGGRCAQAHDWTYRDALKNATVINIGRPEVDDHFFKRVLHLIKNTDGRCFMPNLSVTFANQTMVAPVGRG